MGNPRSRLAAILAAAVVAVTVVYLTTPGSWGKRQTQAASRQAPGTTQRQARTAVLDDYVIGPPTQHGNLAIYPVYLRGRALKGDYMTLEEGLKSGSVRVTERLGGEVNAVLVSNHSKRLLYLMAGELILGGKQDRIVAKDMVVPPLTDDYAVPVFCVEPGRWHGPTEHFGAAPAIVGSDIRKAAQAAKSQGEVWQEVGKARSTLGVTEAGSSYRGVVEQKEVAGRTQPYLLKLSPALHKDQRAVGVVVAVNGEVRSADIFGNQALFRKMWPKLLQGYAADAAMTSGRPAKHAPGTGEAARFLRAARQGKAATVSLGEGLANVERQDTAAYSFELRQQAMPGAAGGATMQMSAPAVHENVFKR